MTNCSDYSPEQLVGLHYRYITLNKERLSNITHITKFQPPSPPEHLEQYNMWTAANEFAQVATHTSRIIHKLRMPR